MNETFLKDRPVLPLVLSMSLPMVLSMLVNSLYNIVDSFFVAQISEDAMTALSLVYPVQNLITAVGVGFGIGINAVIAFHLGAGEKDKASPASRDAPVGGPRGGAHPAVHPSVCPPSWELLPSPRRCWRWGWHMARWPLPSP